MHTASGILVAALLVGDGLAAVLQGRSPSSSSSSTSTGGRHSFTAKRNVNYAPSGPHSLAKAHLKFGANVPNDTKVAVARINAERVAVAKAKRGTGSAVTTPTTFDSEYLTPVAIGTPAQQFNLDFDTGSSDLWVFSNELPTTSINGQALYNPNTSTTAKTLTGGTWSITYGDGSSSSGNVYMDTVTVGGLAVASQAVEPAQKVSASFVSDSDSDGLLGLAFSALNTVKPTAQKTFFDSAAAAGSLDTKLFTADLQAGANGTYDFGFIDSTKYTGSIAYTAVDNSSGFWGFTATSFGVGNTANVNTAIKGIADTGTTLMLMPDAVINAYYTQVSGAAYSTTAGGVVFACSATLPDFTFTVGNGTVTVPGSYINYSPIDAANTTCYGGIQSDASIGFAIFGDVALKSAYVVFDAGNMQLGWAAKASATAALTKASNTTTAAAVTTPAATKKGKKAKAAGKAANAAKVMMSPNLVKPQSTTSDTTSS